MGRDDFNAGREVSQEDSVYEAPAVFDFGSVFEVTCGSGGGSDDENGQGRP